MSFSHLGLSEKVLAAVVATGYKTPTPHPRSGYSTWLARRDVLGIAQTGTGKTEAFVLPMLTMLEQGRARARMPRTLILEPTANSPRRWKRALPNMASTTSSTGADHRRRVVRRSGYQADARRRRGLIATPGRLLDHFERGRLLLSGRRASCHRRSRPQCSIWVSSPTSSASANWFPFTRQTLFFHRHHAAGDPAHPLNTFLHNRPSSKFPGRPPPSPPQPSF